MSIYQLQLRTIYDLYRNQAIKQSIKQASKQANKQAIYFQSSNLL